MTIEKGQAWGEPDGASIQATLPDDAGIARYVHGHRGAVVSARGGDLMQTLGLAGGPRSAPLWFPMDLGFIALDGGAEQPFSAHAIARGPLWSGAGAAIMNAAWLGDRYLGPKSHPNDGLLDVTFGSLPPRQRWAAAKRAKTGVHVPHPSLTVKRVKSWEHTFERPRHIWLDGQRIGRANHLVCRLESDSFTLVG